MVREVVEYLNPSAGGLFIDCTLGGGGHAESIAAEKGVKLIAFDQDPDAITAAKRKLSAFHNIEYIHDNFSHLKEHVPGKASGVLFDLGVSSYQIDAPGRGFGYQKDGPLDMRMNKEGKLTAAEIVNRYPPEELERIFKQWGEERFSRRISRAISAARPVAGTFALKEIIERATPTWKKRETVARIFQSLRIAVNRELEILGDALRDAVNLLDPGGRIVVLSYHSLEDRIVKQTFREQAQNGILKVLTKKPVTARTEEVKENPRAKSAKLRTAERI